MFDVVTIGTITRDVFINSPLFKVVKERSHIETIGFTTGEAQCFALGSKIKISRPIFTGGGGAHNGALTFARHGLRTAIVGSVGDDLAGKEIIKSLKDENVRSFVKIDKKEGTGYSAILMAPGGERTVLVYRGATDALGEKDFPYEKMRAKWTYITPGEIPLSVIRTIIAKIKKHGGKIAMNPSKHYLSLKKGEIESLFASLDVVIMNREEASFCTGIPYREERKIFKQFDRIVPGIAVMTDGARGAAAFDGLYIYRAGIFREKSVVDRTGAGDAFGSGFVMGLIQKGDVGYALRLGAANATSVVESVGASAGILTGKGFLNPRWKNLELDVDRL